MSSEAKLRWLTLWLVTLSLVYVVGWTYTLSTATPAGTDAPSVLDDRIREAKAALIERLDVDHRFPISASQVTDADAGYHDAIHFYSTTATDPILYYTTTGGIDELQYTDSAGSTIQLTSAGGLNMALLTSQTITTPTLTSPVLNTGVSGTAVLDEDDMATDSATQLATQQSIKAYVDDMTVVVQEVYTQTGAVASGSTVIPFDDTIPQKTEGNEYLTLAITPVSATNVLRIEISANFSTYYNSVATIALFQDDTANALAAQANNVSPNTTITCSFVYSMVAGTTSETTFKVRMGSSITNVFTFNGINSYRRLGGVCMSSMTITEYEP